MTNIMCNRTNKSCKLNYYGVIAYSKNLMMVTYLTLVIKGWRVLSGIMRETLLGTDLYTLIKEKFYCVLIK